MPQQRQCLAIASVFGGGGRVDCSATFMLNQYADSDSRVKAPNQHSELAKPNDDLWQPSGMRYQVAAVAVALAGCVHAEQARRSSYESDIDGILAEGRAQMYLSSCSRGKEDFKACGLVAERFLSDAAFTKFRETNALCQSDPNEGCIAAYRNEFSKAVADRYVKADQDQIAALCHESGVDCTKWRSLEMAWLISHNDGVLIETKRRLRAREIQDHHDATAVAEHDRKMQAISKTLSESGDAYANGAGNVDVSYRRAPIIVQPATAKPIPVN